MRASLGSEPTVVARAGLPRPVVWLLWLVGALVGSVVLGFLAGLARPREPDPWSHGPSPDHPGSSEQVDRRRDSGHSDPGTAPVETTSSDSIQFPPAED